MAYKKEQQSIIDWGKQEWTTKSGKKSSETGERYLPEKAIKSLSPAEIAAGNRKKREATAKGKQRASYTEAETAAFLKATNRRRK